MTFRELLEKYKEGTLTEEEKKLVESELEKNEAINDYLAENLELTSSFTDEASHSNVATSKVRKTVNRRLLRVIALSVIIVFVILFSVKYIVSPLVESQYYKPSSNTLTNQVQDCFFDMRALTEVTMPGYGVNYAAADNLGFGKYTLSYTRNNSFTGELSTSKINILKNHRVGSFDDFHIKSHFIWRNLFGMSKNDPNYNTSLESEKKLTEERLASLKELPSSSYVSAYILLNKNLSMQQLFDLVNKYPDINFEWAAIKVSDETTSFPIGFRLNLTRDSYIDSKNFYDKYPALSLMDYFATLDKVAFENGIYKGYELHFTTLMKYLSEKSEAISALSYNPSNFGYSSNQLDFKSYLNYTEDNGINTYAVLVYANVGDLLKLYENENIDVINIDNVLPSQYSNSNNF